MKIKIITPQSAQGEAWAAAIMRSNRALAVEVIAKPLQSVNVLVNGSRPELVVAETSGPKDLVALEALATAHPEIDYVLVSDDLAPEVLLRMMRAGVREVLPSPAAADAVDAAVKRLVRKRSSMSGAAAAPAKQGEILSLVSCKGGSGATFVAANLAALLAQGGERRVALIDLNLQFGDAVLFVSNERQISNVAEVARNITRLDRAFLESAMLPAAPGLWVLAAPEDPSQAAEVTGEHVRAILKQAREMFDFVVLDLGRSLNAVTLQALDDSDRVFAVLQLTLPFIRDGKRLRDVFRSLEYPASKIQWVVNRYQKDSQITLDDLKKTLGVEGPVVLPNNYQPVANSVNQGVPIHTIAPGSPIAKAMTEFAAQISPPAEKAPSGWFSGLMRGSPKPAVGSRP